MTGPFQTVRAASLALLTLDGVEHRQKEAQFLGGLAFAEYDPTHKQLKWLRDLLKRHGLPALEGGGHG